MEVDQLIINAQQKTRYQGTLAQLQVAQGAREALSYQLSEIHRLIKEAARHPNGNPEANVEAYNTAVDAVVQHILLINENIPPMNQFMPEFVQASSNCQALMRHREEFRQLRNQIGHQRHGAAHPDVITNAGRVAHNITGTPISHVIADLTRVISLHDSNRGRVPDPRQRHAVFDFMP